jgi:hypothetical protein
MSLTRTTYKITISVAVERYTKVLDNHAISDQERIEANITAVRASISGAAQRADYAHCGLENETACPGQNGI